MISVCQILLDKQIVDISGLKVVRVNDIQFIKEARTLWLVHVDVGIKGILRRLGWLEAINSFIRWVASTEKRDKFITYISPV